MRITLGRSDGRVTEHRFDLSHAVSGVGREGGCGMPEIVHARQLNGAVTSDPLYAKPRAGRLEHPGSPVPLPHLSPALAPKHERRGIKFAVSASLAVTFQAGGQLVD
jgi:hypothetical protein